MEKRTKRWGDRPDAYWIRDLDGLHAIMPHLMNKRTDAEVYVNMEFDVTEALRYIEEKNWGEDEYKTTLFHCIVTMVARVINERPKLNRFVQAGRIYERDEITVSFVAKRRFTDHSEEALMIYKAKGSDTLADVSRRIVGEVHEMREQKHAVGLDDIMNKFAKLPRLLLMFIVRVVRWLDYWGKVPRIFTEGDTNYTTVLISNLGSIKCPAVYHHLNNYGTNSVMITIGAMHKSPAVMPDGSIEVRDIVDIGATLDERIGDGFYFARSLKLIQHICAHPELLDRPLEEDSCYDYK